MFGETDILFNGEKRKYSFITSKGADLLALSKNEFKKIVFYDFRTIGKEIFKKADKKNIILSHNHSESIKNFKKFRLNKVWN